MFLGVISIYLIVLCVGLDVMVIMIKMQLKVGINAHITSTLIIKNMDIIVTLVSSGITVGLICLIDLIYGPVAKILTDWENPRTQREYDNSFLLKCFLFAFVNNYSRVLYIAFFKGKFYTNPGDSQMNDVGGAYIADTCGPGGCNAELAIQLMFILGVKHVFIKCVGKFLGKFILVVWKKYIKKGRRTRRTPQWEDDFLLKPFERYDIMKQYTEIIVRHGYVLFFTSICPFTPILTLIVNVLEMKLYAYGYTNLYRRPIPRKVEGIETWYYILYSLTWFGVTINALLALLTKDFARIRHYLQTENNNLTSYMDQKFTAFALKDYSEAYYPDARDDDICFFLGSRYPSDHPLKYETLPNVHTYNAFGWMCVVAYLHIVFILTRIIIRCIPDTSSEVKDYLHALHAQDERDVRNFRRLQFMSERKMNMSKVSFPIPRRSQDQNSD